MPRIPGNLENEIQKTLKNPPDRNGTVAELRSELDMYIYLYWPLLGCLFDCLIGIVNMELTIVPGFELLLAAILPRKDPTACEGNQGGGCGGGGGQGPGAGASLGARESYLLPDMHPTPHTCTQHFGMRGGSAQSR